MPAEIVYDIFPMPGVTPASGDQISWANKILKANHPEINVSVKVGKIVPFKKDDKAIKGRTKPAMGAGGGGADYRYSQDQKDLLNSEHVQGPSAATQAAVGAILGGLFGGLGCLMGGAIKEGSAKMGVEAGHIAVIWCKSFSTGELGESVNSKVWDSTYNGKNGIFMSLTSSSDKSCLLHETGHSAGLNHQSADPDELMHATNQNLTKIAKPTKQALANASF